MEDKPAVPVRWATIGSNFIVDAFIEGGKKHNGFVHAAVYSRTPSRAKEYADKHGCSGTFSNFDAMIGSNEVDAVYIASPTSQHAWMAIACLNAGKHVLCEKPVTTNSVELEAVLAAAKASGCAFMEAMRSLKSPAWNEIAAKAKELGPIRHASLSYCQLSSRWPAWLSKKEPRPNAFLPEFSGGALMDLGCYTVYAAVALLGAPDKVNYSAVMLETGVDGAGTLLLEYPDAIATLVVSKMSHGFNHSEFQTENGCIRVDHIGELNEVHWRQKGGPVHEISVDHAGPGLANIMWEIGTFMTMIRDGRQQDDVITWDVTRKVMTVLDTAREQAGIKYPGDLHPQTTPPSGSN